MYVSVVYLGKQCLSRLQSNISQETHRYSVTRRFGVSSEYWGAWRAENTPVRGCILIAKHWLRASVTAGINRGHPVSKHNPLNAFLLLPFTTIRLLNPADQMFYFASLTPVLWLEITLRIPSSVGILLIESHLLTQFNRSLSAPYMDA